MPCLTSAAGDGPPARKAFANFDELEATATRTGDSLTQDMMNEALKAALELPSGERPEACPDCGRALQWSRKPRSIATIRGPVTLEREYAYCRACRKGVFPR